MAISFIGTLLCLLLFTGHSFISSRPLVDEALSDTLVSSQHHLIFRLHHR